MEFDTLEQPDYRLCRGCERIAHIYDCPYCQAEQVGYSDNWAMDPDAWMMLKGIHDEQHVNCNTLEGN